MDDGPDAAARDEVRRLQAEFLRLRGKFEMQRLELAKYESVEDAPKVTNHFIRVVIDARRAREGFFGADYFADPAWDLLLELFSAEMEQRRMAKSRLCAATPVPPSTAIRWLDKLGRDGFVIERADPVDKRRIWVELSPRGYLSMQRYFEALGLSLPAKEFPKSHRQG